MNTLAMNTLDRPFCVISFCVVFDSLEQTLSLYREGKITSEEFADRLVSCATSAVKMGLTSK